ncbi:MAG: decaprenyl-phosphate phosphoribosyltransferase [Acidobacteriota bacterium]
MAVLVNYFKSLRVKQWIKNLFIFAPMIFSMNFTNINYLINSIIAFFLFSIVAGNIYVLNDCIDKKNDINHPKKKFRPIASGKISVPAALVLSSIVQVLALTVIFVFNSGFFLIASIYIAVNISYSAFLKKIAIFDVMIIAIGFVLRVMIGGEVNDIFLSPWIFIITFLLALFLGLVKRRQELSGNVKNLTKNTRKSLENYNLPLLDQLISITTSATLISYITYVLNPEIQKYFKTKYLYLTVPFVIFGIFRYLYLTYIKEKGENPEDIIYTDIPFILNIALWLLVFILLIYF